MRISIIGSGSWGTALGSLLCDNGHDVLVYGRDQNQVDDINLRHQNLRYFPPDIVFNAKLKATSDLRSAVSQFSVLVIAVPSTAIRSVLESLVGFIDKRVLLINTAKGFDFEKQESLSHVFREVIPSEKRREIVSLIGPTLSIEVAKKQLTCIAAVSRSPDEANEVAKIFSNEYFRVYTGDDEIGAEIGAAMKNPIAICSGILKGLGYGDNARAALVTRGLHEMANFGVHFGGRMETYLGLTGLGDLIATTSSDESRNFRAGLEIGQNDGMSTFGDKFAGITIEGVAATKLIYEIAKREKLSVPIINSLYGVLYLGRRPSVSARALMTRPLKNENE